MAKKVLIVEDYEDSRILMKYLLETYGFQVIEAGDGIEAFDKFKQHNQDLILKDISLNNLDGLTETKANR